MKGTKPFGKRWEKKLSRSAWRKEDIAAFAAFFGGRLLSVFNGLERLGKAFGYDDMDAIKSLQENLKRLALEMIGEKGAPNA